MTARWTFVRHGQSVANRDGWISGWIDAPVTPGALEKARELGRTLGDRRFTRIFASDLSRALDTARAIAPDATIVPVPALREQNLGAWDGLTREALHADGSMELLHTWRGTPPGGESLRDVARRALAWFASVPDGGDTLVVGHGSCLRATIGWLDGTPEDLIPKWFLQNLEVVDRHADQATWAARSGALEAGLVASGARSG